MEDVYDEVNGIAQSMTENVLAGKACDMLNLGILFSMCYNGNNEY